MDFITKLTWSRIVDILHEANSSIYLVLPSIDEEMSQLLVKLKDDRNVSIKVSVDNSEDAIRNGYGESNGIDNLIKHSTSLRECKGNRVSFIIVDNRGFIYFPESRIFVEDPEGPNAIEIDPFTIARLIAHYFPPESLIEKERHQEAILNRIDEQSAWSVKVRDEILEQNINPVSVEFDNRSYEKQKESFKNDPPTLADLQRKVKTYSAKIQFVELKFSGINITSRNTNLPKDALPIKNEELNSRITSKIKLFDNLEGDEQYAKVLELKREVEELREKYLKPVTCREGKSLIAKKDLKGFKDALKVLKNKLQNLDELLANILEQSIYETKDLLKTELQSYFKGNTPRQFLRYDDSIRKRKIDDHIEDIVKRTRFPDTTKLIKGIELKDYYYDLTYQDFSDDKLIAELRAKKYMEDKDIDGIVDMKNAFRERL